MSQSKQPLLSFWNQRGIPRFSASLFAIGIWIATSSLLAQTLTVIDGEVNNTSSTTTLEMLNVEMGGTLNLISGADLNFTGTEPTTIDNSGIINSNAASNIQLTRGVTNSGAINVDGGSTSGAEDLVVQTDGATLTGGGTVTLGGTNAGITGTAAGNDLTIGDQTIQGDGALGRNVIDINNSADGLIDGNVAGETLVIDAGSGGLTNAGTVQASGGGQTTITGTVVDNAGGTIVAQDGSTVLLNSSTIDGGSVSSVGSGEVRTDGDVNLIGTTHAGSLILENISDLDIEGTISNSGSITFESTSAGPTDVVVESAGATLTGGGTVTLGGTNAGITATALGNDLTIGDQTIQGQGSLGRNLIDLDIQAGAVINANVDGDTLVIDPNGGVTTALVNNGTLSATNGGTLDSVHDLVNNGTIDLAGGTLVANRLVSSSGGVFSGDGTVDVDTGAISLFGLVTVGDEVSSGTLNLLDATFLGGTSTLDFDLFTVTDFDSVSVLGDVTLAGTLGISLADGFTASASDVINILTSSSSLTGAFANVADGDTIITSDGGGSFTVSLTGSSVQLTNFVATAIPEPGSLVFAMGFAAGVFLRRRRKA